MSALKRSLSLGLLTFYGLGTILGVGIYALIGKVAEESNLFTPFSFIIASLIAFFTAISYAELSSRYPKSAGEAYYVERAFHLKWLSIIMGWLVVFTGLVSAATISHGFIGYIQVFLPDLPAWLGIIIITTALGTVAIWGITESAILATIITLIEIAGILLVIVVSAPEIQAMPYTLDQLIPNAVFSDWSMVFSGAFLAFYAFIGFEDMVNVAEEVKNPERNLPRAIFWAFGIASLLYLLVSFAILASLSLEELKETNAPFAAVMLKNGYSPIIITIISLTAIINGMLVQIIMASRVLYGLAEQNNGPKLFAHLNPKTNTPILGTLFTLACIILFALLLPITTLAKITSTIVLIVFFFINIALIVIKWRYPNKAQTASYSIIFPIIGTFSILFFLAIQFWK